MTPRKAALFNLAIAVIFATTILLACWLLDDSKQSKSITYLLIATWWIPFSCLSAAGLRCRRHRCG